MVTPFSGNLLLNFFFVLIKWLPFIMLLITWLSLNSFFWYFWFCLIRLFFTFLWWISSFMAFLTLYNWIFFFTFCGRFYYILLCFTLLNWIPLFHLLSRDCINTLIKNRITSILRRHAVRITCWFNLLIGFVLARELRRFILRVLIWFLPWLLFRCHLNLQSWHKLNIIIGENRLCFWMLQIPFSYNSIYSLIDGCLSRGQRCLFVTHMNYRSVISFRLEDVGLSKWLILCSNFSGSVFTILKHVF